MIPIVDSITLIDTYNVMP